SPAPPGSNRSRPTSRRSTGPSTPTTSPRSTGSRRRSGPSPGLLRNPTSPRKRRGEVETYPSNRCPLLPLPAPSRGEGRGEGKGLLSRKPLTRIASQSDFSPQGRGEVEVYASNRCPLLPLPAPSRGEGRGEGKGLLSRKPLTRIASQSDFSPQGRGEGEVYASNRCPLLPLPAPSRGEGRGEGPPISQARSESWSERHRYCPTHHCSRTEARGILDRSNDDLGLGRWPIRCAGRRPLRRRPAFRGKRNRKCSSRSAAAGQICVRRSVGCEGDSREWFRLPSD